MYFDEPTGQVKIQTMSKNVQRNLIPKHIIRDLWGWSLIIITCDWGPAILLGGHFQNLDFFVGGIIFR